MRADVSTGGSVGLEPDAPPTPPDLLPSSGGDADDSHDASVGQMPCPNCGALMPDLKGGKASICPVCGFKDSCCY